MTLPPAGPRPRAPLAYWRVHRYEETLGFVWRFAPGFLVSQSIGPRFTLAAAQTMARLVDLVEAEDGHAEGHDGLLLFHDWRSFKTYDSQARENVVRRMRTKRRGFISQTWGVWEAPSRMARMAVEAINLTCSLAGTARIVVSEDIHRQLQLAEILGRRPEPMPTWFSR